MTCTFHKYIKTQTLFPNYNTFNKFIQEQICFPNLEHVLQIYQNTSIFSQIAACFTNIPNLNISIFSQLVACFTNITKHKRHFPNCSIFYKYTKTQAPSPKLQHILQIYQKHKHLFPNCSMFYKYTKTQAPLPKL